MHSIAVREVETLFGRHRRAQRTERFLKGPIRWSLIEKATALSGPCLPVYLAVQHMTDLTKASWVKLPPTLLKGLGVSRDAKSRALRQLADARLIEIENAPGRATRVRLCETEAMT